MTIKWLYVLFSLILVLTGLATLMTGETPWMELWNHAHWNPLLDERLPRLIVLAATGASLATAGAVLQALFYNPLASPSVLGISSGGCIAVVLVFIFNLHLIHPYTLPLAACLGCFAALGFVYGLSRLQGGSHLHNLILTGIALSTLLIALQNFLLYTLRDNGQLVQTITEWEAGSSLDRHWQHVHMQLPLAIVGLSVCWFYRHELNILSLGEEEAKNLGIDVKQVRWRLFLAVALLVGGSLAGLGMIAFFGLILPHLLRSLHGANHRSLIPLCIIGGAAILTTLDLTLRLFHLHDFTLGNVSAIGGGLFFLILLFKKQRSAGRNLV